MFLTQLSVMRTLPSYTTFKKCAGITTINRTKTTRIYFKLTHNLLNLGSPKFLYELVKINLMSNQLFEAVLFVISEGEPRSTYVDL
jgi:hypothetical protein